MDGNEGGAARRRALALAVAIVLALGAAACGSDDDDGDGGDAEASNAAEQRSSSTREVGGSPEEQIRALYASYVGAVYGKSPEAACDTMTPAVQRYVGAGVGCRKRFADIGTRLTEEKPFIVELSVNGSTARARVKTKTSRSYPILFAKVDGRWKISGGAGLSDGGAREQQVRATLDRMGKAIEKRDARTACAILTPASRRGMVTALRSSIARGGGGSTCVEAFGGVLRSGKVIEDPHPKILSVGIEDGTATVAATVSHEGKRQIARLVESGGRWMVVEWFRQAGVEQRGAGSE
jgi:hypothetical protein